MFEAKEIARWFLLRNKTEQDSDECIESISNLKLQKLLYYAQGVHLAVTGERLFEEEIYAWKHGPVVPEVYDFYKINKGNPIDVSEEEGDTQIILNVERDVAAADSLEFVFNEYGQYSAWGLRNKTHQEKPWNETPLQSIMNVNLIREFFKEEIVEIE
ncbi:Panacea domain-containing protein [Clostridium sp.]|uniref:Panacea domain-containing protein n=1 Tax=Clostridium sp. TaxID=1506 RepID=UPI002615B9E5|nr:type II toxin-antitoxin system antitoxin SocA domain-containing protein [Clostridium sp.]